MLAPYAHPVSLQSSTHKVVVARANNNPTDPTLFACADANCNQAATVQVGQCATYRTGVWAFWQRESATGAVGSGTGTRPAPAPAPAPVNPFDPFPFVPPADETDGQDDNDDDVDDD